MKHRIAMRIAAMGILVMVVLPFAWWMGNLRNSGKPKSEVYPACGLITKIESDTVWFETQTGNTFAFTGSEDYEPGDLVAVIFDDNGTSDVHDDSIEAVRYAGYLSDGEINNWVK